MSSSVRIAVGLILVTLLTSPLQAQRKKYVPSGRPLESGEDKERAAQTEDEVGRPYYVFDDKIHHFSPGGWMPDGDIALAQSLLHRTEPYRGRYCYRAICDLRDDAWMGVAFLPGGRFEPPRGRPPVKIDVFQKLKEAKKGDPIVVRFWARSPNGATVQFKVGGIDEDSVVFPVPSQWIKLTTNWRRYTLDVTGEDLSGLRAGFIWVINVDNNPKIDRAEFCLDDIYFTKVKKRPRDTINDRPPAADSDR